MKKIILIFSLIITFLSILIVSLPLIFRLTGTEDSVKAYLFRNFLKDNNLKINLSDFKIGMGSVEISNLIIDTKNENLQVTIQSVRFNYDLSVLLLHPLKPMQSLNSISLIEPKITILPTANSSKPDSRLPLSKFHVFLQKIAKTKGLNYFRVQDGNIVLKINSGNNIVLLDHFNGLLRTSDFNLFQFNLDGDFLGNRLQKIDLSAELNLQQKYLKIVNVFNQFRFKPASLTELWPEFRFFKGLLNGWVLIETKEGDYNNFKFNGQIALSNGTLNYKDYQIDSLTANLILSDNQLIVDSLQGRTAQANLSGKVFVDNIFQPRVFGHLKINKMLLTQLPVKLDFLPFKNISFSSALEFMIDPHSQNWQLQGRKGVIFFPPGHKLTNVQFKLINTSDSLILKDAMAVTQGQDTIQFNMETFKKTGLAKLQFKSQYSTGHHVIFDRISNKINELHINLDYNYQTGLLAGQYVSSLYDGKSDSVLTFSGQIKGDRQQVVIDLEKSNYQDFNLFLQLTRTNNNWRIKKGIIQNFPFGAFTNVKLLNKFLTNVNTEFHLSGLLNKTINSKIILFRKGKPTDRIELLATISNLFSKERIIDGLCRLKQLNGQVHLKVLPSLLNGYFDFSRQIYGNIRIDLSKANYLSTKLTFNDFKIMQAISDSIDVDDFRMLGSLNGVLDIAGDFNNPKFSGNISGDRFVFNNIGYYQLELKFAGNKEFVKLDSLLIAINNLPILQGRGNVDIMNDSLDVHFTAQDVDVEQLWSTFSNKQPLLTGTANYELQLKGKVRKPVISLNLNMKDGYLGRIPFDHLSTLVKNEYLDGQSFLNLEKQKLIFNQFELTKYNQYTLNGLGELPFDPTQRLDLYLNFKGDLLGLIPYYQPFFERATSDVEMHLAIGGSPDAIRLSSGYLLINHGELWMKNVARHVTNISGVIEKKNNSNQVNFINLSGQTGGETLTINTVRNVKLTDGRVLKPWYFKDLDLDFGVLKLTTTGHGVRLHIPGLMMENEQGRLYLTGMNPNEDFYFAGPIEHPVAHGKVILYDTRLTFPFLEQGKPSTKENTVVSFLQNINWDVLTVSGEDVLYFREIPAYIDNVNTELYIDETSPGLHFKGILNKGTFHVTGKLSSSRGRLEYLDQTFRVDYFQAEFLENSPYPVISGQAWTTIRDSIGAVPKTIYLKLYAIDKETRQEKQQGNWDDFKFKLVSADPKIGESQELVLADMGFSVNNLADKVTSVGGAVTEKYVFRPLFRPIERALERNLGIDLVRFNSNIARNLFYSSLGFRKSSFNHSTPLINPFSTSTPYLFLMQSSEITLGKYLTQNLFFTYTGQLVSFYDQNRPSFDINHSFGLEYRFLRNILLEIEYDRELMGYYKIQNQKQYLEDIKIRVRHSFTF